MKTYGNLTENEKKLLTVLYAEDQVRPAQSTHNTERYFDLEVTRNSAREYDIEVKGKVERIRTKADRYGIQEGGKTRYVEQPVGQKSQNGFEAWLPLAVIYDLGDWGAWVEDWSMIRDDEKENQWRMFHHTLKSKKLV